MASFVKANPHFPTWSFPRSFSFAKAYRADFFHHPAMLACPWRAFLFTLAGPLAPFLPNGFLADHQLPLGIAEQGGAASVYYSILLGLVKTIGQPYRFDSRKTIVLRPTVVNLLFSCSSPSLLLSCPFFSVSARTISEIFRPATHGSDVLGAICEGCCRRGW